MPQSVPPEAYVIDFGADHGIAEEMTQACDHLGLGYRLTRSSKLVLAAEAVETLRNQPGDANGGISDDDDGVPCVWIGGYAYPVLGAFGPVS